MCMKVGGRSGQCCASHSGKGSSAVTAEAVCMTCGSDGGGVHMSGQSASATHQLTHRLVLLGSLLPKLNFASKNTYEAKKLISPV